MLTLRHRLVVFLASEERTQMSLGRPSVLGAARDFSSPLKDRPGARNVL